MMDAPRLSARYLLEKCSLVFMCVLAGVLTAQGQDTCSCAGFGGCAPNQQCDPDGNCNAVNVAYGKEASISSRYHPSQADQSGPGCMAVNGRTGHDFRFLSDPYPNCVHSLGYLDNIPDWWEVDLGANYTVSRITIYSRAQKTRRLAGIWIYVDGQLCVKIPGSYSSSLGSYGETATVSCISALRGRRVRFSKEGSFSNDDSFINLCEVQIWVCKPNLWGPACDRTCSGHCLHNAICDNFSGLCANGCEDGFRGGGCFVPCGRCSNSTTCDQPSGNCPSGCQLGYLPPLCLAPCSGRRYGDQCVQQCGQCAGNVQCTPTTGHCPDACRGHFQQPLCKDCVAGYYGSQCNMPCGNCSDGAACDMDTGRCPGGCRAGYQPPYCQQSCSSGTHGVNCTESCGQCAATDWPCDAVTGHCGRCRDHFSPPLCTECVDGYYGEQCGPCGQCGDGQLCDKDTGHCPAGCTAGHKPPLCQDTCTNRTFGENCARACGRCQDQADCNVVNGSCSACERDYILPLCQRLQQRSPGDSEGGDGAVIGGAVGAMVAVLILVVAIAAFIVCRRRPNQKQEDKPSDQRNENVAPKTRTHSMFDPVASKDQPPRPKPKPTAAVKPRSQEPPLAAARGAVSKADHIYVNVALSDTPGGRSQQSSPAIGPPEDERSLADADHVYANQEETEVYASFKATEPELDSVQKYLVDRLASGQLRSEFKTIPKTDVDEPTDAGTMQINYRKNRFAQIVPYDRCRVVLRDGFDESPATDFVNASYITGYTSAHEYIAAQGPRDNTVADMWRMVWQEEITHIVMLTNLSEGGKTKCEQYWPEGERCTETYGPVTVTMSRVDSRDNFYVRTFTVNTAGSAISREITQYHYVSWPDHGVPTTTSLVRFWRDVSHRRRGDTAPLLVHCSAGVGRTGTYIGLDIAMKAAVQDANINVLELVTRLRQERTLMVQAIEQYVFLHEAVLQAYTARDTLVSLEQFDTIFPEPIAADGCNQRIDKEFESLANMRTLTSNARYEVSRQDDNVSKNRNKDALPDDNHLVYLTEHMQGRNQYINAVFMPTLRDPKGSILTQLPLPDTLVDFWRLVYGSNVTTIVSLSSPNEEQEVTMRVQAFCQYWPLEEGGQSVSSGPYVVTLVSKTSVLPALNCYTLSVQKQDAASARTVTLMRYSGWTGEAGCDVTDMVELLDRFMTSTAGSAPKVVIQCCDGVSKSGLFSTLCDIINRMTYDRVIDVYMTVRHAQSVSPNAVTSLSQYRYCYQVAQRKSADMNVYANT